MAGITRRQFLQTAALAGGTLTLPRTLHTLGANVQTPLLPKLRLQGGDGQRVLILGAGIAGLVAAYELGRVGYACQVLEARQRPGGRIWTIRGGDPLDELGEANSASTFDEGLYFNAGADRIPQGHRNILAYCKALGVRVRPFVTLNTATYYYNEGVSGALDGQKVRLGRAWTDLRGYALAMLAQGIDIGRVQTGLDETSNEQMVSYLESFGDLSAEYAYEGSGQAGYSTAAGAFTQEGTPLDPLALSDLLRAEFWRYFPFAWHLYQQPAVVHAIGGMDRIVAAFVEQIGAGVIEYGAEVRAIRRLDDGVQITYVASGEEQTAEGDYCICTLPLTVLHALDTDFPDAVRGAIGAITYEPAVRAGLQFARRFWEDDEYIYGGGTYTNLDIGEIWYPSEGYHAPKGILNGAHTLGEGARALGDLEQQAQLDEVLAQGAKIHPQYSEAFETGVSIAWQQLPYSQGAWALYTPEQRSTLYPQLFDFDERIQLAGDHMSYLNGWIEGAVLSALFAITCIDERTTQNA